MNKIILLAILIISILTNTTKAQSCEPKFVYSKRIMEVSFVTNSKTINHHFIWDFGDGSAPQRAVFPSIIKTYTKPGTYYVCVKDSLCNSLPKTFCDSVTVSNDTPIIADFSYRYDAEGEITLLNRTSSSTQITFSGYSIQEQSYNFIGNDSVVHYLRHTGNTNVCIYAFDEFSNYQEKCSTILVPPMTICYPDFLSDIIDGSYHFYDMSKYPTFSADYLWDFGDGTTSTEWQPIHDYKKRGTFDVSLTINGPCNRKTTKKMTVYEKPICQLKIEATVVNQKATITISDSANSDTSNYSVDFGDGNYMIAKNKTLEHTYADSGTYTIKSFRNHSLCGEIYGNLDVHVKLAIPIYGESFNFVLYPNPSAGLVNMVCNNFTISSIEVIDMLGAKQNLNYEINKNEATIDINSLEEGIYYVKATNQNGEVALKKLVKSIKKI